MTGFQLLPMIELMKALAIAIHFETVETAVDLIKGRNVRKVD